MKMWRSTVLILTVGCGACSTFADPGSNKFGPLQCETCMLQIPPPNEQTLVILEDFYRSYGFGKAPSANERIAPGDAVMVCNRRYCVNYVRTTDGRWQGQDPSPLQQVNFIDQVKRLPPELAEDWLREQRKQPREMLEPTLPLGPTGPRRGVVTVGPISNP